MRLISQDGTRDVSYENVSMYIADYKGDVTIWANDYIIGEYSTKEKALEVMKKVRENWKDGLAFFYFPDDEENNEEFENDSTSIPRDKIRDFCDELMNKGKTYCNPYYTEIVCEIREKFLV